jgi:OFA family oxalate/formate antiporter-like MFS transporter
VCSGSIPRRITIVLASLVSMACSGSVYAWSIFVDPLRSEYRLTTTHTQVVFGFIFASFTITMLFVSRVEQRYGPKITVGIGGMLFCVGYLLASVSGGELWLLVLGIGIVLGIGMAFVYVTVLSNLVRWFPGNKGLATGLAVAGFGGGAIIMSQLAQPLLNGGMGVLEVFRLIGIGYGALLLGSAVTLSAPANYTNGSDNVRVNIGELLRDKRFRVLMYTFFTGTFAGMLLTGNLKSIGLASGVSAGAAVLAVGMLSLGNALGRIVWGQVHDMLGGRKSVIIALSLVTVLTLVLLAVTPNDIQFVVLTLAIGLGYGANFVLYAAAVSEIYGVNRLGTLYPIISLAYGLSGVIGPVVGGLIVDLTQTYDIAIVISVAVSLCGVVGYAMMMPKDLK